MPLRLQEMRRVWGTLGGFQRFPRPSSCNDTRRPDHFSTANGKLHWCGLVPRPSCKLPIRMQRTRDVIGNVIGNVISSSIGKRRSRYYNLTSKSKAGISLSSWESVLSFLKGNDVFIILPTLSGKSLCFSVLHICIFDYLYRSVGSSVIVVSPLKALMKDQVRV